jgi:hypothetical protein
MNIDNILKKYKKEMLKELSKEVQPNPSDEPITPNPSDEPITPATVSPITDEMLKEQIMKGQMLFPSKKKILCFSCGSNLPDRFLEDLKKDLMCPICFNKFSF